MVSALIKYIRMNKNRSRKTICNTEAFNSAK